jgi:peptidoglycan/xylan/chitin deacetylase (PgdA/CDA1 family)
MRVQVRDGLGTRSGERCGDAPPRGGPNATRDVRHWLRAPVARLLAIVVVFLVSFIFVVGSAAALAHRRTSRSRPALVFGAAVVLTGLLPAPAVRGATASPSITASLSAPAVRVGWSVTVRGRVSPASATPYVVVQRAVDHAWSDRDHATVARDGTFAVSIHPMQVATYVLRVRSADGTLASGRFTLEVVPPPTISASLAVPSLAIGSPVTISGTVHPATATRRVVAQRLVDGRWQDREGAAVAAGTGAFRIRIRPTSIADYTLRVRSAGGSVVSPVVSLRTFHVANDMVDTGDALPGERVVAFTFDDGPADPYTADLLDVLAEHGVDATFGIVGYAGAAHEDLLRRELREGHRLVNQTWNHPDLTRLSNAEADAEIASAQALIDRVGGSSRCVRPPYGARNSRIDDIIARHNASATLLWTIDPSNYLRPGTGVIVSRIMASLHPGAIIGIHDGGGDRSQTVAAVDQVIPKIRAAGYQIRPVC